MIFFRASFGVWFLWMKYPFLFQRVLSYEPFAADSSGDCRDPCMMVQVFYHHAGEGKICENAFTDMTMASDWALTSMKRPVGQGLIRTRLRSTDANPYPNRIEP